MHYDAYVVVTMLLIFPVRREDFVWGVYAVNVEVHGARTDEAEDCTTEDDP